MQRNLKKSSPKSDVRKRTALLMMLRMISRVRRGDVGTCNNQMILRNRDTILSCSWRAPSGSALSALVKGRIADLQHFLEGSSTRWRSFPRSSCSPGLNHKHSLAYYMPLKVQDDQQLRWIPDVQQKLWESRLGIQVKRGCGNEAEKT